MTEINQSLNDVAITQSGGDNRYRDKSNKLRQLFFEFSGLIPFFVFAALFIGAPTLIVILNAFKTNEGAFTLSNVLLAFTDVYYLSLISSLKLGLTSALTGVFFWINGFLCCFCFRYEKIAKSCFNSKWRVCKYRWCSSRFFLYSCNW